MVRRNQIEYLKKGIRREETLQMNLPFVLQNELDKSLADWGYKFNSNLDETIRLYDSSYSNIEWFIIKTTRKFDDFETNSYSKHIPIKNSGSFRIRIPNHFFELDLEIKINDSNKVNWIDSETDAELLALNNLTYHKFDNVSYKAKELIVREEIIQYLKEVWDEYKLPSCDIKVTHKRVHFVDTKTLFVEKAIFSIIAEIFGLNGDEIKKSVDEKFKLLNYYFDNMKYEFIDVYEELPRIKRSGDKLIYPSEHRDLASRFVKRFNRDETEALEIKEALLTPGLKKSTVMMPPKFNHALVFRDDKDNIEAIIHLCFETNTIENEKHIIMSVNDVIFKNLNSIIKSIR